MIKRTAESFTPSTDVFLKQGSCPSRNGKHYKIIRVLAFDETHIN